VFAELPRLLERAGPGSEGWEVPGHISAVVTVLVDGDDLNEPIADNVRGLLDGHIVLDRRIAERGRFPAIDLARSLSRSVPECNSPPENQLILRARQILATHADVAELVRLGAYRPGTDAAVDEALILAPRIEAVLRQGRSERSDLASAFAALRLAIQ
jgi:flagellum-specific ATP synthase